MPTLEALKDGYDVYFVEDASGGTSQSAHNMAFNDDPGGRVPITCSNTFSNCNAIGARKDSYTIRSPS